MGKLIIVRHGHTTLNSHGPEERLRAWLDVPLSDQGLQEAEETAAKLADFPIDAIYCSDLIRARQTAQAICRSTQANVTATNELRPWNLGAFGGQRVEELIPFLNLLNDQPDIKAPSGESFNQFYARYSQRLQDLLRLADKAQGYVVAVTHVRNLLAATTIIEGGDSRKVPVKGGPSTGTITIVEKIGNQWKLRRDDGGSVVQAPLARTASHRREEDRQAPLSLPLVSAVSGR